MALTSSVVDGGTLQYLVMPSDQTLMIIEEAASEASGVHGRVSAFLSKAKTHASTDLSAALSAVEALAMFTPTTTTITYSPPTFDTLPVSLAQEFDDEVTTTVVDPDELVFSGVIDAATPASYTLIAPPAPPDIYAVDVAIPAVNAKPEAPVAGTELSSMVAPVITVPDYVQGTSLTAPSLQDIDVPVVSLPLLPTYTLPDSGTAPQAPIFSPTIIIGQYEMHTPQLLAKLDEMLTSAGLAGLADIEDRHVARSIARSTHEENAVSAYAVTRGIPVDASVIQATVDYVRSQSSLMHSNELRSNAVARSYWTAEAARLAMQLGAEAQTVLIGLHVAFAKSALEVEFTKLEAQAETAKALVALYNAKVTEYSTEADLYRTTIEAELLPLKEYEALVDIAKAKGSLNKQIARNYSIQVGAQAVSVDAYAAQISALAARVSAYKAGIESVQIAAELAKAKVSSYGAEVDAYRAELESYRAEFEKYDGTSQRVVAVNSARASKVKAGASAADVAAATAMAEATNIEIEAMKLRLQAMEYSAHHTTVEAANGYKAIKASINGLLYGAEARGWGVDQLAAGFNGSVASDTNKLVTKYYASASESAERSVKLSIQAAVSAAEVGKSIAENAGKTAAAIASGALSAAHVSASIAGAGNIDAAESASEHGRDSYSLGIREQYETKLKGS